MQYIKLKKLTQKKQVLCGLQGFFLLFNCQTPASDLTKEECQALIEVLELKNELTDMEMQTVYFRGCYDGIGYLKKAGIL